MEDVKTVRKAMVPRAGVEPARPFGQRILSPQRLPFRHPGMSRILPSLCSLPLAEIFLPVGIVRERGGRPVWPIKNLVHTINSRCRVESWRQKILESAVTQVCKAGTMW